MCDNIALMININFKIQFKFFLQLKQSEIMNLAVLTGRQVAKQLKVFIVSHSGEIADVTLHSSCSSQDLLALKVCLEIRYILELYKYKI